MDAMRRFVSEYLSEWRGKRLQVLDVGSMDVNGSYRPLFDDRFWTYTGLDIEQGQGVDIAMRSPYKWEGLRSRSFDVVISGQAFEHIEFPWVTILQVARVLKVDGLLCLIVPSSGSEHRYPVDCWRYYPDGVRALAAWADLEVLSAHTAWERGPTYQHDESEWWADTVLIAKRVAALRSWRGVASEAKRAALLRLLSIQAARRQSIESTVAEDNLNSDRSHSD
jgi:SAM-dependent methyltransferase